MNVIWHQRECIDGYCILHANQSQKQHPESELSVIIKNTRSFQAVCTEMITAVLGMAAFLPHFLSFSHAAKKKIIIRFIRVKRLFLINGISSHSAAGSTTRMGRKTYFRDE